MKVMHWNSFCETDKQSGIKRYEDELYNHLKNKIDITRIQKTKRNVFLDKFKNGNADIVHATFQNLAMLKITKHPKRFIITIHDLIPKLYFPLRLKIKYMWYLNEFVFPFIDEIIVDSEYTKKSLIDLLNIDQNKIHVIYLGKSPIYKEYDKNISKKYLGLPNDKKLILIVSSNEPWKNVETMEKIIDDRSEYQFVKIGYETTIKKDNVINLGYVHENDMPYLYSACDVFVHTSAYEGFGFPVLEAMACGCPVVSSNATSLPEVIGNGGVLVNTMSVPEYCNAIDRLLSHEIEYNRIKNNGIKQASKFTWERTAKLTLEVYHKCLNGY